MIDYVASAIEKRLPLGAELHSWAFNDAGFDYWSPELFQIHGLDPNRKAPTVDEYLALVHPEDRAFVAQAIQNDLVRY